MVAITVQLQLQVQTCLLLLYLITTAAQFDLTVFHTNDIHARFDERGVREGGTCKNGSKCYGGMARHTTYLRQNRGNTSLLLSGGDWFTGTIFFTVFNGNLTAEFINSQNYTAIALGNHDFDKGPYVLADMIDKLTMPVLVANMDVTNEPRLKNTIKKSMIKDFNGTKVGIVGYIIPETKVLSNPGPTVIFSDVVVAIRDEVGKLKDQGVNIIVAVGHAGFMTDKRICNEVPDVDIVVGGHTNTFLYTGTPPSIEEPDGVYPIRCRKNSSVVVQDYAYGKYMGQLKVSFDDAGVITKAEGNPVLMNESVAQDPAILAKINFYKKSTAKYFYKIVGYTNKDLTADRKICRQKECLLGDILADAYLSSYRVSDPDTVLGIVNGGSLRTQLEAGNISYGNLLEVTPFGNTVDRFTITGEHLLKVFEHSVSSFINGSNAAGAFLQISGAKVAYNVTRPVNSRVMELYIQNSKGEYKEISSEASYKCVANNYILAGGDEYAVLTTYATDVVSGAVDVDVFTSYVMNNSPIDDNVERNRIVFGDEVVIGSGSRTVGSVLMIVYCVFGLNNHLWVL